MVAFNFQPQFVEAVASGKKQQTIRQTARAKVGDTIQLYTGMRTKSCKKLGEGICIAVKTINLGFGGAIINGVPMLSGKDKFAQEDGFVDYAEMAEWFFTKYGYPFDGYLTEWKLK